MVADLVVHDYLAEAVEVTNQVARTFALAIRFLPAPIRDDVYLLYLVCRTLDDLVDDGHPEARQRLESVKAWAMGNGSIGGREEEILAYLLQCYPAMPCDAIADFCDAQLSSIGTIHLQTEDDVDWYSYGVAGTVGRLMAAILGVTHPRADVAARALGIAMQRTNILRDLDEDLDAGHLYVAQRTLDRLGVTDLRHGDRTEVMRLEIAIADGWYNVGLEGTRFLKNGAWQVRAAGLMYRAILRRIEADGLGRRRPHRASVSRSRKGWLVTRALMGM